MERRRVDWRCVGGRCWCVSVGVWDKEVWEKKVWGFCDVRIFWCGSVGYECGGGVFWVGA